MGIDPGTHETGLSVTEGRDILFWGVKTWKRTCSRSCADVLCRACREISRLIEQYEPQVLVMECDRVMKRRGSETLDVLVVKIKQLAEEQGIEIHQYEPQSIKLCLCGNKRSSKMAIARELAERYPELQRHLDRGKGFNRYRQKYWQKMFCAVSLCLTHEEKHKSKHDSQD